MKKFLITLLISSFTIANSSFITKANHQQDFDKALSFVVFEKETYDAISKRLPEEEEPQYEEVTLYAQTKVNVRNLPDKSGKIIKTLNKRDKVTVIAYYDGWYETKKHNYIKGEYLAEERPPATFYDVTDEERYWLYQLVYAEAGTQSHLCKKYITSVVFNLRADSRFPNTIIGVIFNGNAFSPTFDGSIYSKTPDAATKAAVDEVIQYGPTTAALYFEANYCHSTWHAQQTFLGQVDDVLFYK